MQVGDLVKCPTANGALGVVIAIKNRLHGGAFVEVVLAHNNALCCFQHQHLEVISDAV